MPWKNALVEALKADVESHDAMLWTTPHLSEIRHAEQALLDLLAKGEDPPPSPGRRPLLPEARDLVVPEEELRAEAGFRDFKSAIDDSPRTPREREAYVAGYLRAALRSPLKGAGR